MLSRYGRPYYKTVYATGNAAQDTEQLKVAAAIPGATIELWDKAGIGGFTFNDDINIYGKVIGINKPNITVNLSAAGKRGLRLRSGGSIESARITRNLNFGGNPTNGSYGCAITAGEYTAGRDTVKEFYLKDIDLIGGSGVSWNLVSLMGDVSQFEVDKIKATGPYLIPILLHWSSDKQGTAQVVETYHPRKFEFGHCWFENKSDAVDSGNTLSTDSFGLYFSGCHDFTVKYALTRGGSAGHLIAIGDFGDEKAHADSKGRLLSGIKINELVCENVPGEAVWVAGAATKVSYLTKRWLGVNNDMDVTIDKVTLRRGNNSTSTNPGKVYVSYCRNVRIPDITITNLQGAVLPDNDAVVQVDCSVDCEVAGYTESGSGWIANSGKGLIFRPKAYCTSSAPASNYDGIEIMGGVSNATVKEAVSANDTSITLDVTADIYPGMMFEYGSYRFEFTEGFMYDTVTAANNLGAVLGIKPAPIAIPDESTIELLTGVNGIDVIGSVEGFNVNFRANSTDARMPRVGMVKLKSRYSQVSDAVLEGGVGTITESTFDFSSMNGTANQEQVDIQGGAWNVINNDFNRDTRHPKAPVSVFRQTAASSKAIISNNRFWGIDETQATKGAIRVGTEGDPVDLIATNMFDPSISVRVSATSIAGATTIGGQTLISDTAVRSTGTVEDGTITFDSDPAAAGVGISGITTEGTFSTLNGGATTATTTNGSRDVTLSSMTGITEGCYITIAGVTGARKVWRIMSSTVIRLTTAADATVAGAAVAYSAPVNKTLATYAA